MGGDLPQLALLCHHERAEQLPPDVIMLLGCVYAASY
jgi:hypothetical protein